MTMPASKWDLACEHLNALNEQAGEQLPEDMGVPEPEPVPAGGESVDLYSPNAAERLGLTLIKGTG